MDYQTAVDNFSYDPVTGKLTVKKGGRGRNKVGEEAGGKDKAGYRIVALGGKAYKAHRIAYLLMTGVWPENQIDHINGVRDDNRWENLRAATSSENRRNAALPPNNTSGVMGVSKRKDCARWRARIKAFGKMIHLGLFLKKEEAIAARKAAEVEHGFHPNHGRDPS